MATLNREAAEIMLKYPVHACTDITGFGLLGHLAEMVEGSNCGIELEAYGIPAIPEAMEYGIMGIIPAGAYKNREFREKIVDFSPFVGSLLQLLLFDPQTSGGLLISVENKSADPLLDELRSKDIPAAIIGKVLSEPAGKIIVR
jgi:selenide,water dikinase